MICDVTGAVSREGSLHMVPRVDAPMARIACGATLAHPMGLDVRGAASIDRVRPVSRPAITLHAHQHCLAIGHRLIHIEFEISDVAGGACEIHPRVIEKILGIRVIGEGYAVSFRAVVLESSVELSRTAVL